MNCNKIYANSFNAKCYHKNREVDIIIELENGELCAFDTTYKRPDGVYVVPITALEN